VVGDIDEIELAPLLDKAFAGLPAKGPPAAVPEWQAKPKGRIVVVDKPVPQSVVLIAQAGIKRNDPDWYVAYVLNYILGGGSFSSRLMNEVREKRGLVYSIQTRLSPYSHGGLIVTSAASANERVADTVDIIRQEWKRMAEGGITAEELANAKTYLTGSFALNLDSTSSIADLLQNMQIDKLGKDYLEKRNSYIEAVTLADVNRVAARLLKAEDLVVIVVGQPKNLASTP
jgi:zinc protease